MSNRVLFRTRRGASTLLAIFVVVVGAAMALKGGAVTNPTGAESLPKDSQSYIAAQIQKSFPAPDVQPVLVVVTAHDGGTLSDYANPTSTQVTRLIQATLPITDGSISPYLVAPNHKVAFFSVPMSTKFGDSATTKQVEALRTAVRAAVDSSVDIHLTGTPAITADFSHVFDGANTKLLLTTVLVVGILLILTYRSPFLWLIPLIVVGMADSVTGQLVKSIAPHFGIRLDDQATGIAEVLVFGAGTDYALLLISRYRDELRHRASKYEAMGVAWQRTLSSIVASSGTVALSLLVLLLGSLTTIRALGFAGAIGVIIAALFTMLFLPAALVIFGRRLFWPLVPNEGDTHADGKIWSRVGGSTRRHPGIVLIAAAIFLGALSLSATGIHSGLSLDQQFRSTPESIIGQRLLGEGFPQGSSLPTDVIVDRSHAMEVYGVVKETRGVASVAWGPRSAGYLSIEATLTAAPSTKDSNDTIDRLRANVATVANANVYVGGSVAQQLDGNRAVSRDLHLAAPLIFLIVVAVLIGLLRSLLAPILLLATVITTFFSALGLSWLIFTHVYHFAALDPGVVLFGFLFLVALGVDYNIFLVSRAKEESEQHGTSDGMLRALVATGGVITSAGILLASVFAVLGVLPLIALTQTGVIVGVGVLLDTLLVRTVVVPALAFLLKDGFWWPRMTR